MDVRYFRQKTYGDKNTKILFLVGGWGSQQWELWPVSKILESAGYKCITITLEKEILSTDIRKSVKYILHVKQSVIEHIHTLRRSGYRDFSIFGTSLGALIGLLVADECPFITKAIFNTPGMDFAESLWSWEAVLPEFAQEVHKKYQTLAALKDEVVKINPVHHMHNLHGTDLLIYVSTKDKVALSTPKTLFRILSAKRYHFKLVVSHSFGHSITGFINLINVPVYLSFLSNKKSPPETP
jgi:esterase/lipase